MFEQGRAKRLHLPGKGHGQSGFMLLADAAGAWEGQYSDKKTSVLNYL
jgi:hypothetical protein